MLKEFIDRIVDLGQSAQSVRIIHQDKEPGFVWVDAKGTLERMKLADRDVATTIDSLDSFVAICNDAVLATAPEVYHNDFDISVVLDRAERREIVKMPLVTSDRYDKLATMWDKHPMTQKAAIRYLRQELDSPGLANLVAALRKVDFRRSSVGVATVEHGKESLGRSVEAAIQGASEIPDEFMVRFSCYQNAGLDDIECSARCWIWLDVEEARVEFGVYPDELRKAMAKTQQQIAGCLAASLPKGTPIYHGSHGY